MTVLRIVICALCLIGSGWSAAKPPLPEKPDRLVIQHRKLFQNLSAGDRKKLLRTVKDVDGYERDTLLSMVTPLIEEFPQLSEQARSSILFFLKKCPAKTPYCPEPNEARALSVGYLRKTLLSTEGVMTKKHVDEAMELFWSVANKRTHEIDPDFTLDQHILLMRSLDWDRRVNYFGNATVRSEYESDHFFSLIEEVLPTGEYFHDLCAKEDRQSTIDFYRDCLERSSAVLAPLLTPEISIRERIEMWKLGGMCFNRLPTEKTTFMIEQFQRFIGVLSGENYREHSIIQFLIELTEWVDQTEFSDRAQLNRALTFFEAESLAGRIPEHSRRHFLSTFLRRSFTAPADVPIETLFAEGFEEGLDDQPNFGAAYEVHNYGDTEVEEPLPESGASARGPESASAAPRKKSLLDAVMDEVNRSLTRKKAKVFSYGEAVSLIKDSIKAKYKGDEKAQALRAITKGFEGYPEAQEDLAHAFSFVREFHPSKLDLWMDQFVTESVKSYEGDNGLSCTKGVQERATLGLRGMDVHLDKLFAQAEGPATMKVLLANCNFGDTDYPARARFVAGKLIAQGWTQSTTEEEAGKMFFLFLEGESKANHLTESQTEKYRSQFEIYAELIEGDLSSETSILKRTLVEEAK